MNHQHQTSNVILPDEQHSAILYRPHQPPERLSCLTGFAVFPGSFNPLHEGHKKLRSVAQQRLGREVVYEISVSNVEKHPLTPADLQVRLAQFENASVLITNAARFIEKARIARQSPFVVGFDTAQRILDPRFYGNDRQFLDAMTQLTEECPRIVVGGRLAKARTTTQFCSQPELNVPVVCKELFEFIPESEFRSDISSSELRAGPRGNHTD